MRISPKVSVDVEAWDRKRRAQRGDQLVTQSPADLGEAYFAEQAADRRSFADRANGTPAALADAIEREPDADPSNVR